MAILRERGGRLSRLVLRNMKERANENDGSLTSVASLRSVLCEQGERVGELVFPMSAAQQGLWFLDLLEPERALNYIQAVVRVRRLLDIKLLQQSLNAVVQRHESLRSLFRWSMEGQPVQVVTPTLVVILSVVDLRGFPEAERGAKAQRLALEEAQRPFDLKCGPLLRVKLLLLGEDEEILLLTMHHIVADKWSMGVLLHELISLYEATLACRPSPLLALPLQYADFVIWQQKALQGDILTEHLAYWKRQMADSPAALELPATQPRGRQYPTSRGTTYDLLLPVTLTDALQRLSRQQGMTMNMLLAVAFQTLLYRYTGQDDVVIGNVIAGRTRLETEALIGCFSNVVLLRSDLSGNPTFLELLERVRVVMLESQAHQDLPFEYLIKELVSERHLGQNSLVKVAVEFEPTVPTFPPGWELIRVEAGNGTSIFDLTLHIEDRTEGLLNRFEYSTDLFDQTAIVRMAGHWHALLRGIVSNPEEHIATLPLLSPAESHQLLVEWNDTHVRYPTDKCVHQLFEDQVERTPEAEAVVFEDQYLTYRDLNARANQLAHHLRQLGVGPDVLVGLYVERSFEMIVGLLGILKAGGAYVPLDPNYPSERLTFLLQDTQIPILLTQQRLLARLPQHDARVICLDSDWKHIVREPRENPVSGTSPEDLVYVIYTSGSTGRPKGVMMPHSALCNHLFWMLEYAPLGSDDRVLQCISFSFDPFATEFFTALLTGAQLVMIQPGGDQDSQYLVQTIIKRHITVINSVPSMLEMMLIEPDISRCTTLRYVFCGGETCPVSLVDRFFCLLNAKLFNLYGPTEACIAVTARECQRGLEQHTIPIGRPIANTQIYLLDSHMQPVPIGVPGELYIGGICLARGYRNRPELTAERFILHPFSDKPGARLYKTGDLARRRADGTIEYLGRLDFQVKLRGFRIELGEIEAVLGQHPAVRQAIVVARENVPGNKLLIAYVVLHKDQEDTIGADLKRYVLRQVPVYMVPSAFVLLERLPLMRNGKVDLRALPEPEPGRDMARDNFVAPILPVQQQLAQIWEELLDVRPIGIGDNFFDLGGHSLLAMRLIERMTQVCGKRLPLSTLYAGATIADLAAALTEQPRTDSRTPLVAVQVRGSRRPFFFLHGQWTGGAFYSLELARYLGPDQPLYLLEPYKFDNLAVPPTLEEMAAAHIDVLRSVQPEGPYLLGGWCNGGLMAYEIARQLYVQGQIVDLLVLMDSDTPAPWKWQRRIITGLGTLLRLGQARQMEWFLSYRYIRLSFHYWRSHIFKQMRATRPGEHGLQRSPLDAFSPQPDVCVPGYEVFRQEWPSLYSWAASGYMPHSYPGKITFFWTEEEPNRRKRWGKLMGTKTKAYEEESHIIPGNHLTSRTRYLPVLAERLRMCLNKVQLTLPS